MGIPLWHGPSQSQRGSRSCAEKHSSACPHGARHHFRRHHRSSTNGNGGYSSASLMPPDHVLPGANSRIGRRHSRAPLGNGRSPGAMWDGTDGRPPRSSQTLFELLRTAPRRTVGGIEVYTRGGLGSGVDGLGDRERSLSPDSNHWERVAQDLGLATACDDADIWGDMSPSEADAGTTRPTSPTISDPLTLPSAPSSIPPTAPPPPTLPISLSNIFVSAPSPYTIPNPSTAPFLRRSDERRSPGSGNAATVLSHYHRRASEHPEIHHSDPDDGPNSSSSLPSPFVNEHFPPRSTDNDTASRLGDTLSHALQSFRNAYVAGYDERQRARMRREAEMLHRIAATPIHPSTVPPSANSDNNSGNTGGRDAVLFSFISPSSSSASDDSPDGSDSRQQEQQSRISRPPAPSPHHGLELVAMELQPFHFRSYDIPRPGDDDNDEEDEEMDAILAREAARERERRRRDREDRWGRERMEQTLRLQMRLLASVRASERLRGGDGWRDERGDEGGGEGMANAGRGRDGEEW